MDKKLYYQIAQKGSLELNHPGMVILKKMAAGANSILDLGCGEGTRLNFLAGEKKVLGIDISKVGIDLAKKSFPYLQFRVADLEKLPVEDKSFDLVYSAFVMEHLTNPEKVLEEAVRVIADKGYLVLIAPNFGAPNRVSPPFKGSKLKKLMKGIWADIWRVVFWGNCLNWQKVESISKKGQYDIDWDTTVEPYIGTLVPFLKSKGLIIEKADSCWGQELLGVKIHQKIFRFLGSLGLYPFWMWGPHLLVVARKGKGNEG